MRELLDNRPRRGNQDVAYGHCSAVAFAPEALLPITN
jgi:hypothetical protein